MTPVARSGAPTQAVILAGGRGTRLGPLTDTRPKPMVEFHGKPFLEYLLDMLRDQGIEQVLLLLGYLPDVIIDHFGDGSRVGIDIEYSITEPDDLTSHRLQMARHRIDEHFLLMYCDNYWPMRLTDMWEQYLASGAPAQITVYSNRDGFTRDSVRVGQDGFVEIFDRTRSAEGLQGVEIGYSILHRDILDLLPPDQELAEVALYPPLTRQGRLHAYWTEHRYYSVGDLRRLPITEAFLARDPAVILDRDGVLNERPPKASYVQRPDDFVWLPGSLDALALLHDAGYRVVVISNQAGVARGLMTEDDVRAVNRRMIADAAAAGGSIDAVYFCPHGWDEGCACRKPRPGMLHQAQREHHLDLSRTLVVGDDERDGMAAASAGAPFARVDDTTSLLDITRSLLSRDREFTP